MICDLRRPLVGLLLLAAVLLLVPGPAQAAARPPVTYAALGDSFSSGVGSGTYDLAGAPCLRSSTSYAVLWARREPGRALEFLACSGATTVDAARKQVPRIPRTANLVTVTIGGNDTGFASVLRACSTASRDATCSAAVRLGEAAARTTAPTGLAATLVLIRKQAPRAKIVVLGYPRLFEPGPCAVPGVPNERRRTELNRAADTLNAALLRATRAAGARFVDVRPAFAGHGVCAPSGKQWINGPGPGPEAYHPNPAGHALGYLPALTSVTG